MGFFDKLLSGKIAETLENAVQNATNNNTSTVSSSSSQPVASSTGRGNIRDKSYFQEIITTEFPQYSLRESIPVSEFGGEGRPYDFGLYQEGNLVALVSVIGKNEYRTHGFWNSEKKAAEIGMPFIYYFRNMTNPREVVIGRVHRFIGR